MTTTASTTRKTPTKPAAKPATPAKKTPKTTSDKGPSLWPVLRAVAILAVIALLAMGGWALIAWAADQVLPDLDLPAPNPKQDAILIGLVGILLTAAIHTARRRWWAWRTSKPAATDGKATPDRREKVAANLGQSLAAVLLTDGEKRNTPLTVSVSSWKGAHPTVIPLGYPASADTAVHANLQQVLATVERLHPAKVGRWTYATDSEHFRLTLTDSPDQLAPLVSLPQIEEAPNLEAGVVVGIREDGTPWRVPLLYKHLLIGGASGAGKSSPLWGILRGLSAMIGSGQVVVRVADPKGGMDFGVTRAFARTLAVTAEEVADMLDEAVEAMRAQARALAEAGEERLEAADISRRFPVNLVMLDELSAVIGDAFAGTPELLKRCQAALALLLSQGRAAGFVVVAAVQDPRKQNVGPRGLFISAIGLRMSEAGETDLILGRGARSKGALADTIPESLPGVAYVTDSEQAGFMRVRMAYVAKDERKRMAGWIAERQRQLGAPPAAPRPISTGDAIPVGEEEEFVIPAGLTGPPAAAEVPAPMDVVKAPAKARRATRPATKATAPPAAPPVVADEPELPAPAVPAGAAVRARDLDPAEGGLWHFDGDADPVTITDATPCDDDPDRIEITYTYPGHDAVRVTDVDGAELLRRP